MTISDRIAELLKDQSIRDQYVRTIAEMSFRPVTDTLTGDEVARIIACIAYAGSLTQPMNVKTEVTNEVGGRVYHSQIDDGVNITERIGG